MRRHPQRGVACRADCREQLREPTVCVANLVCKRCISNMEQLRSVRLRYFLDGYVACLELRRGALLQSSLSEATPGKHCHSIRYAAIPVVYHE